MLARKNSILNHSFIIIMSTITSFTLSQSPQCQLFPLYGRSFFSPRSQSLDAPRDLVGTHRFMHRYDTDSYYGTVSITPQYMHSYKKDSIAEYFFGTNLLHIAGSQVSSRTSETILADYFGLSPAFESTVEVNPSIANFVADIGFYGQWKRLYAMLHIPIAWTKWEFKLCETIQNKGTDTPFPAKYMTTTELIAPIVSFTRALKGGVTFGDLKQGLCYGIVDCPQTKAGIADIRATIGYDIWLREHGHAGFYAHCAAPTGNRSSARYLFEPILGNGHHWEIGLGFNGRVLIWEADGDQTLSLFFDGKITHLFKSRQCRSFDFCRNCFGSRYTLLKQFDGHGNYTGYLVPAINITTLPCDVVIDSQFDIAAMISYLYRGFEFDAGYNTWARTREKITICGCIEPRRYGFKGIQNVVNDIGQASAVTQHSATLHGNLFENQSQLTDDPSPCYINTCNLDPSSAASERSFTHKLFLYLGYAWNTQETTGFMPFIGIGGSVEFEGVYPDYTQPNKNSLSQYSIWLKGGTGF
ncbi:hypothetical protein E3J79_00360 [Candidatus Dependentiae bacterium]|nr:MAG: hypothetical protein E3J79_00360 [Candidatus Dependentiae bacterium]